MSVDVVVAVLTVETCPEGGKDAKLTLFIDTRKKKKEKKYIHIFIFVVYLSLQPGGLVGHSATWTQIHDEEQ